MTDVANETTVLPTPEIRSDVPSQPSTNDGTPAGETIDAASKRAVDEHRASQQPPGRKNRKPAKYPPAGARNGNDNPAEFSTDADGLKSQSGQAPSVAFDEKTFEILVEAGIEAIGEFAGSAMRMLGKKNECAPEVIQEAVNNARGTEKTRAMIKVGALGCLKKYCGNPKYGPETALLGGLAIWGIGTYMSARTLIKKEFPQPAQTP